MHPEPVPFAYITHKDFPVHGLEVYNFLFLWNLLILMGHIFGGISKTSSFNFKWQFFF